MDNEKEQKGYVVDGYLFATEKQAQEAKKELEGIKFLQRNNDMKDAKVLVQIYNRLLEQGLFHTPIGLNYLKYLQNAIRAGGGEDVAPIPVRKGRTDDHDSMQFRKNMKELNDVGNVYRKRFRVAMFVISLLSACLVFMICVAATTDQPNILNYEDKIVNKYEQWEQELERREQDLKKTP